MCGIIGYIGSKPVVPVLIDGLRRMEYRGYDSAGVALVGDDGISLRRSAGKLANLELTIQADPVDGLYGVGHTRWATHGRPTEENAHPHRDCTGRIVVVHNGIIENYLELKKTTLGPGAKASHLSYLGDATIGAGVNVGAGTITCNYDGTHKYPTVIEDGAFIGSDSQLIAPVTIGKGAYVAAGSSITGDVPPGALAIGRGQQVNKEGWVARRKGTPAKT